MVITYIHKGSKAIITMTKIGYDSLPESAQKLLKQIDYVKPEEPDIIKIKKSKK